MSSADIAATSEMDHLDQLGAKAFDGFLDAYTNGSLNFNRRCAQVGHTDADHLDVKVGEFFLVCAEGAINTAEQQQDHQKVGRDRIVREPSYGRMH